MKSQPPETRSDRRRIAVPRMVLPRPRLALVTCSYYLVQEIADAVDRSLTTPAKRQAVVVAARRRILAQHTYEHRLRSLFAHLKTQGI